MSTKIKYNGVESEPFTNTSKKIPASVVDDIIIIDEGSSGGSGNVITQVGSTLYIGVEMYTVTGTATHGSIKRGTGTFPKGENVTIYGEAEEGYLFESIVVNGETFYSLPYTFAISEDTSFEITYVQKISVSHNFATETAGGTTLSGSISADVGDLVVCAFSVRSAISSISSGWTLLGTSLSSSAIDSGNTNNQTLSWAYKIATSTTETFSVTQANSARIYINMVTLKNCSSVEMLEWTYTTGLTTITLENPNKVPMLYAVTVPTWTSAVPYGLWTNDKNLTIYQLGEQTQSRTAIAEDTNGDFNSVTFTKAGSQAAIIGGRLKLNMGVS